ncbi:MAG: non-homologous end-joining DNA ligase [Bacillota bacterium]
MPSKGAVMVRVGERDLQLTHLDKVYWPDAGLTKRDLIDYYVAMAPVLLPHLKDRPLSLVRYPNGILEEGFYQKDAPQGMPEWVRIAPLWSKERSSYINFILCDNVETLVWMANSGVIEINPWLSRYDNPDCPDFAVVDVDPSEGTTWEDVKVVARMVKSLLDQWKLVGFPKVSGATGLHVYIPVEPRYSYKEISTFVKYGATFIRDAYPEKVTLERKVKDRTGKVYIDYPQNARGQTISSVYGVRASPGAPVSMPVTWEELDRVHPKSWSILTAPERVRVIGDLFSHVLTVRQSIDPFLSGAASGKHN